MRRIHRVICLLLFSILITACAAHTQQADTTAPQSELQTTDSPADQAVTASQGGTGTHQIIPMSTLMDALASNPDAILLDVRTAEEYWSGYIPGAINFSSTDITADTAAVMLPDKNQTIYVYCRSGNRSRSTAEALLKLGYTRVIDAGGIMDWNGELTPGN